MAARTAAVRPKTLRDLRWYLEGPHFRALHGAPLDRIGRKEIAACIVVIERERGTPTALRARAALSSLFVWAMRSGLTDANPAANTPKPAIGRGRDRVLSDDELGRVWRAAGDDDHGRIVKLLILCGGRRAEIGGLCWSELDFDAGIWTLPPARAKTGRAHALPIMPMMTVILAAVPRRATRDQLFGERGAGGFAGWSQKKRELDAKSGVAGWVLHDIRRTVATGMANLGVAPHIIEEILGHSGGGHKAGVAGIYNRRPMRPRCVPRSAFGMIMSGRLSPTARARWCRSSSLSKPLDSQAWSRYITVSDKRRLPGRYTGLLGAPSLLAGQHQSSTDRPTVVLECPATDILSLIIKCLVAAAPD